MSEKSDSLSQPKEKFKLFIPGKSKTYQEAAAEKIKNIKNIVNENSLGSQNDDCSRKNEKPDLSNSEFKFEPTPPPDPRQTKKIHKSSKQTI